MKKSKFGDELRDVLVEIAQQELESLALVTTQAAIARSVGVAQSEISQIMRDSIFMSTDKLGAIVEALGYKISFTVEENGEGIADKLPGTRGSALAARERVARRKADVEFAALAAAGGKIGNKISIEEYL